MKKKMHIEYTSLIDHCGECFYASSTENICELTGTIIQDYWDGVQPDCPLEDNDD